jgi:N-acetylmuramic acid 6-phosphate etherase
MNTQLYLGIEGGGTRSTAVLADARGHALAEVAGGPANLSLISDRQLLWLLRSIAEKLPHVPGATLAGIGIGLAGARSEVDRDRIRQAVARVWPRVHCVAGDDLGTALAAAPMKRGISAQVLVLSGTGSCCFGKANDGRTAKIGGRGHVIGDRGSACDIGQRALKALMSQYDHERIWPKLGEQVLSHLLLNEPEDLIPWSMNADKTAIASVALAVFAAAKQRDALATSILAEAAASLANDGAACASRLAAKGERVQFVFNGGVLLKNPAFAKDVARRLLARWPSSIVTPVERGSAWGGVALAQQYIAAGPSIKVTEPVPVLHDAIPGLPLDHPAFDKKRLALSPTEQRNPRSMKLDTLPIPKAIELMLSEDSTITDALRKERSTIAWVVEKVSTAFTHGGQLYYVGAGTSGRLGVLDASECPPTFRAPREQVQGIIAGGQRALWSAVEGAEDDPTAGSVAIDHRGIGKKDVVIGIAASGRTPFVWGALARAAARGATTVLVCFNPEFKALSKDRAGKRKSTGKAASHALFFPDKVIAPNLGPEVLTGSTRLKSGTATKLLLNIFTTLAMTQTGKVMSNLMVDLNPSNVKLRDRAVRIVQQLTHSDEASARAALEASGWVVKAASKMKSK